MNCILYNSSRLTKGSTKLCIMQWELRNDLTEKIIGCAIEVHRSLGPGFLEPAYQECINFELNLMGFKTLKQLALPIIYNDIHLDHGYQIDILVENQVVVELKTVEFFTDVHFA